MYFKLGDMTSKPLLEDWYQFHDTLVGYIYDSKEFEPETRVQTAVVRWFNASCSEASCADGEYRLGKEGSYAEHNRPAQKKAKQFYVPGKLII